MTPGRARRLLVAAFAFSLLLHLLFAFVVRRPPNTRPSEAETISIVHRQRLAMTKMRTPPPRPKATPVPHPVASARPAPQRTHGTISTGTGPGRAPAHTPGPARTPVPTPAASTAANGCAGGDESAAVTVTPPPPDISIPARADGTSGIADVAVQLDAQGAVLKASVARSSGNGSLDLVALAMARQAQYSPALHDCKPVAGAYTFSVKFYAW